MPSSLTVLFSLWITACDGKESIYTFLFRYRVWNFCGSGPQRDCGCLRCVRVPIASRGDGFYRHRASCLVDGRALDEIWGMDYRRGLSVRLVSISNGSTMGCILGSAGRICRLPWEACPHGDDLLLNFCRARPLRVISISGTNSHCRLSPLALVLGIAGGALDSIDGRPNIGPDRSHSDWCFDPHPPIVEPGQGRFRYRRNSRGI
jgi:hypothetical protein